LIAVVASVLLLLYILVPSVLFRLLISTSLPVKKFQKTKSQEITFAAVSALLPFCLTLLFVWTFAHWPWPTPEDDLHRRLAYRAVYSSLTSDKQLDEALTVGKYWPAVNDVVRRQLRFLSWYYLLVCGEAWLFWWLAAQYRADDKRFRDRIGRLILPPVLSEWHVLLTNFGTPTVNAQIEVDVLSTDGVLYQGGLRNYFFDAEGELSGLLLSKASRYDRIQYTAHQQADFEATKSSWPNQPAHKFTRDRDTYWRLIPGANLFYIPKDRIANINVRHLTPPAEVPKATEARLLRRKITGYAILEQLSQPVSGTGDVAQPPDISEPK
jgi:hypothetical protein